MLMRQQQEGLRAMTRIAIGLATVFVALSAVAAGAQAARPGQAVRGGRRAVGHEDDQWHHQVQLQAQTVKV